MMTTTTRQRHTQPLDRLPTAPARHALTGYARQRRLSLDQLADVVGLNGLDLPKLLERRWLPWHLADRIAIALGHHPYEFWPEWFEGPHPGTETDSDEDGACA